MNVAHVREQLLMPPPPDTDEEEDGPARPLGNSSSSGVLGKSLDGGSADDLDDIHPVHPTTEGTAAEAADNAAAASTFVDQSVEESRTRDSNEGVARGTLAGPRPPAAAVRHVFSSSVAARIRDYYEQMPEASLSTSVAGRPEGLPASKFTGAGMRKVLQFVVSAGGCGLSRVDQYSLAETLYAVEAQFDYSDGEAAVFKSLFPTPSSFAAGIRTEQNRVLARLGWLQVPIVVNNKTHMFYYRDLLSTAVEAVQSAAKVDLDGGALPDAADGSRRRSTFLDSDLFIKDSNSIKNLHGPQARPLFANLHADEALVSWSGAHYVFPIRAEFPSVNGGGRWVTVGYVPHIARPTEHGSKVLLAASDGRNDLLQRCLAVLLRRFVRASERGFPVHVGGESMRMLVPRIGGVVVDFLEERALYALGGTRSNMICSHCRVSRAVCCDAKAGEAHPRDVVETLEAQLHAAKRRLVDERASLRGPLALAHSALAFVPALGAVHGLSTGNLNYFRVITFDLLHVWKLGILRMMAQRLPAFLKSVCTSEAGARMGTVQRTLDVINLRGFRLGRRCRASPAPPGCFVPPKEKQATMNGRSWRHFVVHWPFMVAGLAGPADPQRLLSSLRRSQRVTAQSLFRAEVDEEDASPGLEEEDQPAPCGFEMGEGSDYHSLFGEMPVEDAVQDMYCQAASLSGRFFGDNVAETVYLSGNELESIAAAALKLGRCIQVILGPVHTSKLHRLMFHLAAELQNRGNLSEGDTSVNESLHKLCKKMYTRSNKRGPTLSMQMMRGEQSQTEILRGMVNDEGSDDEEVADESDDEEATERRHAARDGHVVDVADVPPVVLQMSTRGIRFALEDVLGLPGLSNLPDLLEVDRATTVTVAKTLLFEPRFEWDAARDVQYLRATPSFNGRPWYDHLRYLDADGVVRWGQARLVLRRVERTTRHCIVVWRMRRAEARPGCVLSAYGCQRLAWHLPFPGSLWPSVEIVDVEQILRLEHVLPDWRDMADRGGIDTMGSERVFTVAERRDARFFVNAFYPWTSRKQS